MKHNVHTFVVKYILFDKNSIKKSKKVLFSKVRARWGYFLKVSFEYESRSHFALSFLITFTYTILQSSKRKLEFSSQIVFCANLREPLEIIFL